jgi:hypothetical protein
MLLPTFAFKFNLRCYNVEALSLTSDRSRSLAAKMGTAMESGFGAGAPRSSLDPVGVLMQGYLLKRSSNMRADWKRRFFILDAMGHLTYYRDRDAKGRAQETVSLLTVGRCTL